MSDIFKIPRQTGKSFYTLGRGSTCPPIMKFDIRNALTNTSDDIICKQLNNIFDDQLKLVCDGYRKQVVLIRK